MSLLRRRRSDELADADVAAVEPTTPIGDAQPRQRVRVSGQVMRMRARPTSGIPALAVTITDETGSIVAVWTGRRAIGGISLGRKVVLEGVPARKGDHLELTNPGYTLLP